MDKPAGMFDRDHEWSTLVGFATNPDTRATLGLVSGRRRQGKSFLLDALTEATGGFMFTATETTEADALRQFGDALARHVGEPVPFRFTSWDDAITRLMHIATEGPTVAVIDEFPFLAQASPALPSIIQRALDPTAQRTNTPVRLLLCGSALSFMGRMLAARAPLHGRAGLNLIVPTLDYRLAAQFWGITDRRTAALTNAIVGGTPAYRREYTQGDTPAGPDDFDAWVERAVLNPGRPLMREGFNLLSVESELRKPELYHSVLGAIADGNTKRNDIASRIGVKSSDLGHPLAVLRSVGMITHEQDAFRSNRSAYRIADPFLSFHHAILQPNWGDFERPGRAATTWQRLQHTFLSKIVGPHYESMCRVWALEYAAESTLGSRAARVSSGTVPDRQARADHEVDVVVFGSNDTGRHHLLAIGECKWNETVGLGHLQRLDRIRDLRSADALDGVPVRRLLFSGGGFADDLRKAASGDSTIQLVDLERLYTGD